jgi:predicted SnoaL-like aldol condensation-catalyzing enzyme
MVPSHADRSKAEHSTGPIARQMDHPVKEELLVAEGDKVMDHWTATGTQTGAMMGLPATGKRFTMTGSDLCRIEAGKVAEIWHVEDTLTMLQQLGLAPAGQGSSASASASTTATGRAAPQPAKTPARDEIRSLVLRRYEEFIDRGNLAAAGTLVTPDYAGHISGAPTIHGREALKQFLARVVEPVQNRGFGDRPLLRPICENGH